MDFKKVSILATVVILFTVVNLSSQLPAKPSALISKLTGKSYGFPFNCTICKVGVKAVQTLLRWHVSENMVGKAILHICETFHIEDRPVCQGVVSEFKDELLTVIKNTSLSASDTCVMMFGSICSSSAYDPEVEWHVPIPLGPKRPRSKLIFPPKPTSPQLRILQLSDIHLDKLYSPGSNTQCNEPLCCREYNGRSSNKADGAGFWGDYRSCDIPEYTLDNMLDHISSKEKFDFIYWTGDLPPHDIWKQTRADQMKLLQLLTDKLLKYFPGKPIFAAVGNHESAPVDSFPPPFITGNRSESWLYKTLAKSWSPWLPQSTMQTITYGGFYTTLIKPGFRIISVNSNFCDHRNWWLLLNVTDPAQELKWLVEILQQAEDNHEKVHILGHIPPGDTDCYRVWSQNYNLIVVRYADTIAGQFFGHTHFDHYELFFDTKTKKPVSVGYIAPSITTYSGLNPGYRVYTVDGFYQNSSWYVLDHETTVMNLTEANEFNKTVWQKEYSVKKAYNLTDLLPSSWKEFADSLHGSQEMFNKFYQHYFKMHPPAGPCDSVCKDTMICSLNMATFGDQSFCNRKSSTSVQEMRKHLKRLQAC